MIRFLTAPSLKLVMLLACLCWAALLVIVVAEMLEEEVTEEELERREEYYRRGYFWPLTATKPNTKGWRQNMFYRIAHKSNTLKIVTRNTVAGCKSCHLP